MYEYYLPSGFIHEAEEGDPRRGVPEIVFYNPTARPCMATITVYFSDKAPAVLEPVQVKAETNALVVMPDIAPTVLKNAGFCGFKVTATTPLVINHINGVRYVVPKPQFRGGCTNFHGRKLDRQWRIPDGLWLEWNIHLKGDLSKAPFLSTRASFTIFSIPILKT